MYELRALDPTTEQHLYREAYHWRSKRRTKLQPTRMPFEDFVADAPNQVVMGLFNGELRAVYLFREVAQGEIEAHFTVKRKTDPDAVLVAGKTVLDWLTSENLRVHAWVAAQNGPLRRFVETIGFNLVETVESSCQSAGHSDTLPVMVKFAHYEAY